MDDIDLLVAQACHEVADWLREGGPDLALQSLLDAPPETLAQHHRELADHFASQAQEGGFTQECSWNPSSLAFDVYWRQHGRPIAGLEKPISVEDREDARLLACARLMHFLSAAQSAAQ